MPGRAPEHVVALVAVGDRSRASPRVARRNLDDGAVGDGGRHRVDFGRVGLAFQAQDPAHDVDALGVPAGVDAEAWRAAGGWLHRAWRDWQPYGPAKGSP